jgi:hypothetical protein
MILLKEVFLAVELKYLLVIKNGIEKKTLRNMADI